MMQRPLMEPGWQSSATNEANHRAAEP